MTLGERAQIIIETLVKLGVFQRSHYHPPDGSKPIPVDGFFEMKNISEFELKKKLVLALRVDIFTRATPAVSAPVSKELQEAARKRLKKLGIEIPDPSELKKRLKELGVKDA